MEDVIQYNKSLQQRLQEYLEIFNNGHLDSTELIKKEWSMYLQHTLDHKGWRAVWKIPRLACEDFEVSFPTLVLVDIEEIDYENLSASVKVVAVQDESTLLPEYNKALLMNIWPLKTQNYPGLFIETTANALDMYRFFYTHIFLPWDNDDDSSHWLESNLVSRLRFYYDMKNGVIPRPIAEHIRDLINEAHRLQIERDRLHAQILCAEKIHNNELCNNLIDATLKANVELIQIKNEMVLMETPATRNIIIKKQIPVINSEKPIIWMLIEGGKVADYLTCAELLKEQYPNDTIKINSSLEYILENMKPTDTIVLDQSRHVIHATSGLESGGTVKGIFGRERTTLAFTRNNTMLDFKGNVRIENVTINVTVASHGILVRSGKTVLTNCILIGDSAFGKHEGIVVLPGAQLELIDCDVSGFHTAIEGRPNSSIYMKNCSITGATIGVYLLDGSHFKVDNCKIEDCHHYGLCVETSSTVSAAGDFKLLEIIPEIVLKDLSGVNNGAANVNIKSKPIDSPEIGFKRKSSSSESSDDMDELNDTVIENTVHKAVL